MTKSLAGLLGVAATASIVAPTTFLTSNNSLYGNEQPITEEPKWVGWRSKLVHSKDIKNEYLNVECLNEYFQEGIDWTQGSEIPTSFDFTKGCLLIEYYQNYSFDKWWGGFRLIWSLASDNQGLITVFHSRSHNDNLKIDSALYIVGKDNQKWSLKYQQENEEEIVKEDEIDKKFSQSSFDGFSSEQYKYWGFNPDPKTLCKFNECRISMKNATMTNGSTSRWDWKKENHNTSKAVSEWCKNFDNWFDSLSTDKSEWTKIKEELRKLKGTWTHSK